MKATKEARLFSLDEANQMLPRLSHIIEKMKAVYFQLMRLREDRGLGEEEVERFLYSHRQDADVRTKLMEMDAMLREIESLGCVFKGLELGLVDFPAVIDDEHVLLCWQYGEAEITFYHRMDEGFSGRLPLKRARPARSVN